MTEQECDKVLEAAAEAGVILLRCGAEVRRVEDTVKRICSAYGMRVQNQVYSLTNAVMISFDDPEADIHLSRIIEVPIETMRLNQLVHLNQISRDIASGKYSIDEALEKIRAVGEEKDTPFWLKLIAAAMASFCFGLMFGANWLEALIAMVAGPAALCVATVPGRRLSKIILNVLCGIVIALFAFLVPLYLRVPFEVSSTRIMLGAMMPLVPGLAFMNSFRDFANGDYLSGTVRILDAILVGASIAAGAAITLKVLSWILGGAL